MHDLKPQRAVESDSSWHLVGAQCDRADTLDHRQNSPVSFPATPAYAEVWRRSADPPGSIILRYGKTTPIYGLLGSLAVRMVQATLVAAIAVAVQFAPPTLLSAEEVGRPALMIEIDGAIGPATARYVKEALTTAGGRRGGVGILRLNTPGGLPPTTRDIFALAPAASPPRRCVLLPSPA